MAGGAGPWTDDELKNLSGHLGYEIEMFFKQGTQAVSLIEGKKPGAALNALNEAFFVHARTLLKFLYSEKGYPDEALAIHYLGGEVLKEPQELTVLGLGRLGERINRQILHLSRHRLTLHPLKEKWPHEPLMKAMSPAVREFYDRLAKKAPHRVHERLKKAVAKHCKAKN